MLKRLQLDEGWATLFLVWAMVMVASLAIVQTEWTNSLDVIPLAAGFGVLIGFVLAKSQFSDRTAHLFALAYGVFILFWLIGREIPDMSWRERVFDIVNRQAVWMNKVFDGSSYSRDGLIFTIQTSVVFWLLGYTSAWFTFRHSKIWRVILPTGITLFSVVFYYFGPRQLALYLGVFAILALLYISQTHLVERERDWRQASVRYEKGLMQYNFMWASLVAGTFALAFAWNLPALTTNAVVNDAVSNITRPWRRVQDNWTRLFASLRSYGAGSNDPYSRSLVLGGPRNVGNTVIMDVLVEEQLPYVYWQAIAYDTYEDGYWEATGTEQIVHYPDDGPIKVPVTRGREVITQTVINYIPNAGAIYGAPEITHSNKQMFVNRWQTNAGAELVSSIKSRFQLQQGDNYQVVSQMSFADATSLRNASRNYPAWVVEKYLQIPETITPETEQLATQFAEQYSNPFDQSIAIRDYLRTTIAYNDQIEAPPPDVDSVHYVLFESKEGYCNYYASAMVMLLRSNGIPSRLVAGYAQGDYLEEDGFYRVRANNAHTWVEVYFPSFGWIQFEPTAAIPIVDRPESGGGGDNFRDEAGFNETDNNIADLNQDEELGGFQDLEGEELPPEIDLSQERFSRTTLIRAGVGLMALVVAAGAVVSANQFNKQVESDVVKSFGRLGSWANWLGLKLRPHQTPYERATIISEAAPEGRSSIRKLTQQFVMRTFSAGKEGDPHFDSQGEWKLLRPILWRTAFNRWADRLRERYNGEEKPDVQALQLTREDASEEG